ncbi:MAG: methyltransferase [Elusimicrobiota bacterium]
MRFEDGSFRDPGSRVFLHDGRVYRGLGRRSAEDWKALSAARFFARGVERGSIIGTEALAPEDPALPPGCRDWALVLRHEAVPFVSYPYEWSFGMLQDAALLQLDLNLAALDEGLILKDASPYNVQWLGSSPVFIDIASFERLSPGAVWAGYRQFCELFLNPLLLQAYKGAPFQPWLRGSLDGIPAEDCSGLFSLRDLARPGVLKHVKLQARLQARCGASERDLKSEIKEAGFGKEMIEVNLRSLRSLVSGLRWDPPGSPWSDYGGGAHYSERDRAAKEAFVRRALERRTWDLLWDLGCNTGEFSRMAGENSRCVVGMDADPLVVDRLYRLLKGKRDRRILPLVANLADPPPGLGWRGLERKPLAARGGPQMTLCLALVHHLCLGANIPLLELVDWLASLGSELVIEFVSKDDPMARRLLLNKGDIFSDYDADALERRLENSFDIVTREPLGCGTRVLYHASPRSR